MPLLLALLLLGCTTARSPGGSTSCKTDDDCESGEKCECAGVGADPCRPDMPPNACAEARCGGKTCIDPKHPPAGPP